MRHNQKSGKRRGLGITVADPKMGHYRLRLESEGTVYCKLRDISARVKKEIVARDGGEWNLA